MKIRHNGFEHSPVIHEQAPLSPDLSELLAELDSFIGLEEVKRIVKSLLQFVQYTLDRKQEGLHTAEHISLHTIFLGNPGTGKTTIARLMGRMFRALGLLKKGHVVEVDRAGLIAEYVGQTAIKTEKVIEQAMGGILFIDEAYTFAKDNVDFGKEAIEVILKRMEDREGQFVVIAAGYPEEMKHFIEINPGLKDRFKHYFHFQDYKPDELLAIARQMMDKEDYHFSPEAEKSILEQLIQLYRSRDKFFGNGRLVKKLVEKLKLIHSDRYSRIDKMERTREALQIFQVEDVNELLCSTEKKSFIIPIDEARVSALWDTLNQMVGLDNVKRKVNELITLTRYYRKRGWGFIHSLMPHFIFLGNPGTGKTTVARLISEMYAALGLLARGHLVEVAREDLVGGWVGQTEEKVQKAIEQAQGGVLFIDEAYALSQEQSKSDFGQIVIDMLVKKMEDKRGHFIVIAAGYTNRMKFFLDSNPGLHSRFGSSVQFGDYAPCELFQIGMAYLDEYGFQLSEDAKKPLANYFEKAYSNRDLYFGNARFVRNTVDEIITNTVLRLASDKTKKGIFASEGEMTILGTDIKQK